MTKSEPMSATEELSMGDLRLAVCADLGGSIAGLWHAGLPVLRSTEPAALTAARQAACYPLVPYSNRIDHCRFRWQGRDYTTQPNFDQSPHSLHGVGWRRAWTVIERSADHLTLQLAHAPDADWPFAFDVRQTFTLTAESMRLDLALTNTSSLVQPTGLGWHPYFTKRSGSHIHAAVAARWDPDDQELPAHEVAQSAIDGKVADLTYDHCFSGWDGHAELHDERLVVRLGSNLDHLVVYTPGTKPYYCVEPVSHLSNAVNFPNPMLHGLEALAPGGVQRAHMTIHVRPQG